MMAGKNKAYRETVEMVDGEGMIADLVARVGILEARDSLAGSVGEYNTVRGMPWAEKPQRIAGMKYNRGDTICEDVRKIPYADEIDKRLAECGVECIAILSRVQQMERMLLYPRPFDENDGGGEYGAGLLPRSVGGVDNLRRMLMEIDNGLRRIEGEIFGEEGRLPKACVMR